MHGETKDYLMKKLFAVAMLLLVLGGINWGIIAATGVDPIRFLTGKNSLVANALFLAVGVSALFIGYTRDSYLPFLGPSVVPCSLLKVQTPEGADFEKRVLVKPGVKVLYWAAEPSNADLQTIPDWREAYLSFRNAGVAVADEDGYVKLRVRKPQPYTVPMKSELEPHIHFRVCWNNGFIGPVETVTLDTNEFFENVPTKDSSPAEETYEEVRESTPQEHPTPNTSLDEVNRALLETHSQSLMTTEGAPLESIYKPLTAADYNEAYPKPT